MQYQIFEISGKKRRASIGLAPEDFEPDSSYVKSYIVKNKSGKTFMQNTFNDDKWEYLEEIKELEIALKNACEPIIATPSEPLVPSLESDETDFRKEK